MLEQIIQILEKHIEHYAVTPYGDGTSAIVFFLPYAPYRSVTGMFIDAYYRASDKLYDITGQIINELNAAGFQAEREKRHNYKQLAVKSGLTAPLKNTLTAAPEYGTRIVIGVIRVKGSYEFITKSANICVNCGKCATACPTGAISEQGFHRERCIRQMQNLSREIAEGDLALIGTRFLGCDLCQRACPANKDLSGSDPDPIVREYMRAGHMIEKAAEGKKALIDLEPYIGKNYLRPKKLLILALIAAYNINDFSAKETVKSLIDDKDERVRFYAKRLLEKYNNSQ
ncbi:MAG: 4Fe-4S double cluster binding domain-containing protein [Christensenellales bacterium]|jgi:epoxyqueuosine reductase QueG